MDSLTLPARPSDPRRPDSDRWRLRPETWIALGLVVGGLALAGLWPAAGLELFLSGLGGFCL